MAINNQKNNNKFQNILDKYAKKEKDERDKKQLKYLFAKGMFIVGVVLVIVKYLFANKLVSSLWEFYFPFIYLFLFFISFLLFLNVFISVDKLEEDDDFDDDID